MNVKAVGQIVDGLSTLKYFPSGDYARLAIVEQICEMAENLEQVHWLVKRMLKLYNEWPGPKEMRACFCSKFMPKDGVNAYSELFAEGIPSERQSRILIGSAEPYVGIEYKRLLIEAPEDDPEVEAEIERVKEQLRCKPRKVAKVTPMPVNPNFKPITQADVDAAVRKLREDRARAELEAE